MVELVRKQENDCTDDSGGLGIPDSVDRAAVDLKPAGQGLLL